MMNRAKKKLRAGGAIVGAEIGIADPDVSEWLANMDLDWLMLHARIETQQAMDNAYETLSVPGIDAGVIGPFDLSYDMDFGSPLRWDEPRYVSACDLLVEAVHKAGKAAGAFTNEFDRMPWLLEKGHRALMVGEADAFPIRGARAALDAARQGSNP